MFTLRQLEIFDAIVHHRSLTRAAKQLGVSQPALSQQIAKLERELGVRLLERNGHDIRPTEAGVLLAERAREILAATEEVRVTLQQFAQGRRVRLGIGALPSLARLLLPEAFRRCRERGIEVELDVHEGAPGELIELLYARRVQLVLLNEASVARDHLSFARLPLLHDESVLAVPEELELDEVEDPLRDLPESARALLRRTIQFSFGTAHVKRVQAWYQQNIGRVEVVARVRHYETALALVAAAQGVSLVPQGTVTLLHPALAGRVRFYHAPGMERRVVALLPGQYRHVDPWASFLIALEAAAHELDLRPPLPPPPFFRWPTDEARRTANDGNLWSTKVDGPI